eukprot:437717_1
MPFDEITSKTAQEKQIGNKESREAATATKLMDARHMKKLYGCTSFMDLRNALSIKKHPHQNYPTPCIENLNRKNVSTTTKARTKHQHQQKKQNRGRKMVEAALRQANKIGI